MLCSFSNLSEQDLGRIKSLEQELGSPLLAFSCKDMAPAKMDQAALDKIQALEKDLGMALVAVQA